MNGKYDNTIDRPLFESVALVSKLAPENRTPAFHEMRINIGAFDLDSITASR